MAPAAPSNRRYENASKTTIPDLVNSPEKPLTEEELIFFLSHNQCETPEYKPLIVSNEEELCNLIEVESPKSGGRYCHDKSTRHEWKNYFFLYNFFRRRGNEYRSAKYLEKIEDAKGEKIRAQISKIRKLSLEYISLPIERIDPEDIKLRKKLRREAMKACVEDQNNGLRILKKITGKDHPELSFNTKEYCQD